MKRLFYHLLAVMSLAGCSDRPYVIVQIADAQLGFTAAVEWQNAGGEYVNDLTYEADFLVKAVEKVNSIRPDAVVFTGDQINMWDNQEQWDRFDDIISNIDSGVKVFHLPGNHDVVVRDGRVDSSPFTSRYGEGHFVHCERGVRLVGINTSLIKSSDSLETEQMEWLETALSKDSKDEVSLLFGHHPFFMTDIDEPDSYFPIMPEKRRIYFDMFARLDLDGVYAGHRHETFEAEYNGIPMRTTTSAAYQIGKSNPSVRVITVRDGAVLDELVEL